MAVMCRRFFIGVIIVLLYSLAGCQNEYHEPDFIINELLVDKDNALAETIYLNNCGNYSLVEQTSERTQSIVIEGGAEIGVQIDLIRALISAKYASTQVITKIHKVTAAPGTNMEFVLLWRHQVSKGTVTVDSKEGVAVYSVDNPLSVEQILAKNLGCDSAPNLALATQFPSSQNQPLIFPSNNLNFPVGVTSQVIRVGGNTATWGPLNTGVYVDFDDLIQVTYLYGAWWIGYRINNGVGEKTTDGDGYKDLQIDDFEELLGVDTPDVCRPLLSAPFGSLIGSIGEYGRAFFIGNNNSVLADDSGPLYLRINYFDHNNVANCPYGDGGSIMVQINIVSK